MFTKRLIALTLFAALATMPTCVLRAQWVQTNGPYGGAIQCFCVSGANLYAGNLFGVFLSKDDGASWIAVNNGLPNGLRSTHDVVALASIGTIIFAGAIYGNVFRTTDRR